MSEDVSCRGIAPAIGGAAASTAFDDAAVGAAEPDTCAHSITCHPRLHCQHDFEFVARGARRRDRRITRIIAHHHEKEGGVIDERCPVAHHS